MIAFFAVSWFLVGRDPPRGTIIPRFKPPQNLSPGACHFVYRRGGAEDIAVNAGAIGNLAELIRRKLVRIDKDGQLQPVDGTTPQEPDLAAFLAVLFRRGGGAGHANFRAAAEDMRKILVPMLVPKLYKAHPLILVGGAAVLIGAAIIAQVVTPSGYDRDNLGLALGAGFGSSVPLAMALIISRSRITGHRVLASILFGLAALVFLAFLLIALAVFFAEPRGAEQALVYGGLFLIMPTIIAAGGLLVAPSVEGRLLMDEVEGFRMFIATVDGGRHAVEGVPRLSRDKLDLLRPYAIALHVEGTWVNALADALPKFAR